VLLGIAADLSAPPSSATVYRDVCLVAKVFRHYDVVALLDNPDMTDFYAQWFRRHGLFDFVDDLILREQVYRSLTVEIEGGGSLTAHNLHEVLGYL